VLSCIRANLVMRVGIGYIVPSLRVGSIHYEQTATAFSALLRSLMPYFTYLYVPSVIRSPTPVYCPDLDFFSTGTQEMSEGEVEALR
jgi:hypothetical protein